MAFIKSNPGSNENNDEPQSCETTASLLVTGTTDQRRQAAREIITCEGASQSLVTQLSAEENPSVRHVIILSLTQIGDDIALQGLVDCLRSENAALRNEAIEAIKQLPQEIAPVMARLLNDPDPDVRIFTVNILESLCHDDVEKWLLEVIRNDSHVNVCATAVDLLGEVGTANALEDLNLLKSRFENEPYIQFAADLAIRRVQGS